MGRVEVYDARGRRLPFDVVAAFSPPLHRALSKVEWARDDDVIGALARFKGVYGNTLSVKVEDGRIVVEVDGGATAVFAPPAEGKEQWKVAVTLPLDFSDPAAAVEHLLTLIDRLAVRIVRLEGTLERVQEMVFSLEKKVRKMEERKEEEGGEE